MTAECRGRTGLVVLVVVCLAGVGAGALGPSPAAAADCSIRIVQGPRPAGDRVVAEGRLECASATPINADGKLYVMKKPGEYLEMDNDSCHSVQRSCTVTPSARRFGSGVTWCFQMFGRAGGDLYDTARVCRRL